MPGGQFVDGDAVFGCQIGDSGGVEAGHGQAMLGCRGDGRSAGGKQAGEYVGLGGADQDVGVRVCLDELVGGGVREQPPLADDDQVVGGQCISLIR